VKDIAWFAPNLQIIDPTFTSRDRMDEIISAQIVTLSSTSTSDMIDFQEPFIVTAAIYTSRTAKPSDRQFSKFCTVFNLV
jgi:hypothetical protein